MNGSGHEVEEEPVVEEKGENGIENGAGKESEISILVNGKSSEAREDSILFDATAAKPRKGKVQLPPVLNLPAAPSPTRTSPRRPNSEKIYKEFINEESGSSDSEDEKELSMLSRLQKALGQRMAQGALGNEDDESDDSGSEEGMDANSSSTEDGEGEEDEEEDGEGEDEEESEDDEMLNDMQEPGYDSGATAVMAFSKWEGDRLHLWVANAGDSR